MTILDIDQEKLHEELTYYFILCEYGRRYPLNLESCTADDITGQNKRAVKMYRSDNVFHRTVDIQVNGIMHIVLTSPTGAKSFMTEEVNRMINDTVPFVAGELYARKGEFDREELKRLMSEASFMSKNPTSDLSIGDEVVSHIPEHGVAPSKGIIIGSPNFDLTNERFVVANTMAHGAPYNKCWLKSTGRHSSIQGRVLRDRYLKLYPGALKPIDGNPA